METTKKQVLDTDDTDDEITQEMRREPPQKDREYIIFEAWAVRGAGDVRIE